MVQKFKTIYIIAITIVILPHIESAIKTRKKVQIKQSSLTPAEIDPNVSPILSSISSPEVIPSSASELINTGNAEIIPSSGLDSTTIEPENVNNTVLDPVDGLTSSTPANNVDDPNPISKLCKCSDTLCNCCRDFSLPLVPVRGPGCARIHYLGNEKMSVQIKYGDIVLAQRTINGKKAAPICVGLPGGFSRFCARIYGLSKEKSGFKSCLSLELRAEDELEAQLRVSCFRFNSKGFSVTEAEPVPQLEAEKDEDDDDDIFGLGGGDDDDTTDDDDYDDDDDEEDEPANNASSDDDSDYDFRFIEEVFESDEKTPSKKKITITPNAASKDASGAQQKENENEELSENDSEQKVKASKNKKKDGEDYESISDVIYSFLNNFF